MFGPCEDKTQGQRDKYERKKRAEVFYAELQQVVKREVQQMQQGVPTRQSSQHASPDEASMRSEGPMNDARHEEPPGRIEKGKA